MCLRDKAAAMILFLLQHKEKIFQKNVEEKKDAKMRKESELNKDWFLQLGKKESKDKIQWCCLYTEMKLVLFI